MQIGTDDLAPGEVEVGFLIPRTAVENELGHLGREFNLLKRILGPSLKSRPVHVKGSTSEASRPQALACSLILHRKPDGS